jgi:hypothetical protein
MYSLFEEFEEDKLIIAYSGIVIDTITAQLVDLNENLFSEDPSLKKVSRKTSFLITETFQNIVRHKIDENDIPGEKSDHKDFFLIKVSDDRVLIASVNIVENEVVEFLDDRISHLNALDENELKELRKNILQHSVFSEKGGAGLGLIEIIRRSKLPLQKKFIEINAEHSLMILQLEMGFEFYEKDQMIPIDYVENFYRKLSEKGVELFYKGDFSESSNSDLIEMLHSNFLQNKAELNTSVKNIMVIIELLQNASKHGKVDNKQVQGVFSVNKSEDNLYIECGNYINKTNFNGLKSRLETIKTMTPEEIESAYKETLISPMTDNSLNSGLGLLEIARLTENSFSYTFTENKDKEVFYSIQIKL